MRASGRILRWLPAVCLLPLGMLFSQEPHDSVRVAVTPTVTFHTSPGGGSLFVDGDSLGTTPLTVELPPGKHHVRLVPPDVGSWLTDPIVDSVEIAAEDSATLRFAFTQRMLILSTPSGAEVRSGDSLLGTTPLVLNTMPLSLILKKEGYEEQPVNTEAARRGIISAQLKKVWQTGNGEPVFSDDDDSGSSLRLYISGATTIIAGAASAYFKVKADNRYAEYLRNGNPGQLSEVNRLDAAAGVALVATQISLGLFTYFILSE